MDTGSVIESSMINGLGREHERDCLDAYLLKVIYPLRRLPRPVVSGTVASVIVFRELIHLQPRNQRAPYFRPQSPLRSSVLLHAIAHIPTSQWL
jgi:hypothetical protein